MKYIHFFAIAGLAVLASCSANSKKETATSTTDTALAADIKQHIAVLANDSLLGRKPFTVGEDKTIAYIAAQFKKLGLEPGNKGSYFQEVPMVEIKSTAGDIQIAGKTTMTLKPGVDFVASTRREVPAIDLKNSPLVFAGYGIVAPEYKWNDYAGLDVKGKTVVVLVNDPGFQSHVGIPGRHS